MENACYLCRIGKTITILDGRYIHDEGWWGGQHWYQLCAAQPSRRPPSRLLQLFRRITRKGTR